MKQCHKRKALQTGCQQRIMEIKDEIPSHIFGSLAALLWFTAAAAAATPSPLVDAEWLAQNGEHEQLRIMTFAIKLMVGL